MIILLQKDNISFIFNFFSIELYTLLEQYNNMLKKLKQANHNYQKLNQPNLTSYTLNFIHQPCPPNLFIAIF